MDQLEKRKQRRNWWKYINKWRSESSPRGWNYSYRIRRVNIEVREKNGSVETAKVGILIGDSDESDI